ncbi:unnamed protein product [Pleuronectes platessa]|uniref:Uncharacterized protein n=1 Tax=Pleuronectes platessa TaxID=8262 RepID=A0A9N7YFG3_PLEPL|nr:unnamed protein product [Pleuronectes platessa]
MIPGAASFVPECGRGRMAHSAAREPLPCVCIGSGHCNVFGHGLGSRGHQRYVSPPRTGKVPSDPARTPHKIPAPSEKVRQLATSFTIDTTTTMKPVLPFHDG